MLVWSVGLHNACAFYDPGLQRWLSRDPQAEHGGINLYVYAGTDPVNLIDSDGQCPAVLLAIPVIVEGIGMTAETGVLVSGSVVSAGAGLGVGSLLSGGGGSGRTTMPPLGLSLENRPPISLAFPISVDMAKGERNWEKGRGDDPYWDLPPDDLRKIENDPKSTPSQKDRARRIRKQKEKNCS
jgi:hypothetical protein